MVALLSKIFIREDDYKSSKYITKFSYISICVGIILNTVLVIGKFLVGTLSGSVAIIADGYNNLGDIVTNLEYLAGAYFSSMGPGRTHVGGHGRIEWIVALFASYAVITMGFDQFSDSIRRIKNPNSIEFSLIVIIVLIISVLVKLYMAYYNKKIAAKIQSLSLKAVAADCISDSISTALVLISLLVNKLTDINVDGWCGLLVAILIINAGLKSFSESFTTIIGKNNDEELKGKIRDITKQYEECKNIDDIIIHDYGNGHKFIDFNIECYDEMVNEELCEKIQDIQYKIKNQLGCKATIGISILLNNKEIVREYKELVKKCIAKTGYDVRNIDVKLLKTYKNLEMIINADFPIYKTYEQEEVKKLVLNEISQRKDNIYVIMNMGIYNDHKGRRLKKEKSNDIDYHY